METSYENVCRISFQLLLFWLDVFTPDALTVKLTVVYSVCKSTFEEILDRGASFSVHHINTQNLVITIWNHIHELSPVIGEVFKLNLALPDNIRTDDKFFIRVRTTVKYGTETIYFVTPKVWAF